MNPIKAEGILRHLFWGEYSAFIALKFSSDEHANDVLSVLGSPWHVGEKNKDVLVWSGNSDELGALKESFKKYCDNVDLIDSCTHPIDYGDPFEVSIPVIAKEQLNLF